jgi:AmmeMemoRadiSam system protein A
MPLPEPLQQEVLNLARAYIRRALRVDSFIPTAREPEIRQPAGCFVSLHSLHGHRLRGCVGRIDASQPLIVALESASGSVLEDPRFANAPVTPEELAWLSIEVSVLSPPRPAANPLDFEPLTEGIYLTFGNRSGCFLPQVAQETGWSREQLLDRLCTEKMGLPASTWRQPQVVLHKFSVDVIGPEPFETSVAVPVGKHPGRL